MPGAQIPQPTFKGRKRMIAKGGVFRRQFRVRHVWQVEKAVSGVQWLVGPLLALIARAGAAGSLHQLGRRISSAPRAQARPMPRARLKTKAMALVVMTIMVAIDLALKEEMKISLSKRGHCKEKKILKSMMEEVIHLIGINSLMKTTLKEMTKLDLAMCCKNRLELSP